MQTILTVRARHHQWARVVGILFFASLTALTARITINLSFTPVPITLQVLAVLLAGLVLGARAGAASQIAYLSAIAIGLPLSARGLGGAAAFTGATAGYLIAFAPAAFVVGWLGERRERANPLIQVVASLVGVLVIYMGGTAWLAVWLGGDIVKAWQLGVTPFILMDLVKSVVAAFAARSGRTLFGN